MDTSRSHRRFRKERENVLKDIKDFLILLFEFLKEMTEHGFLNSDGKLRNLKLVFESLYLIHGLYGYPADTSGNPVDKEAVKNVVLSTEYDGEKFEDYYDVASDKFWQFQRGDLKKLEDQPREPAHLFLELVREIIYDDPQLSAETAKHYLEGLPDANKFKPRVWATHNRTRLFGVSLGVGSFVRPLFLYIKLVQLRRLRNAHCQLKDDIEAFGLPEKKKKKKQSDYQKKQKKDTEAFGLPEEEKKGTEAVGLPEEKNTISKYVTEVKPCANCALFFDGSYKESKGFPFPFGNCAEYDVNPTKELHILLSRRFGHAWDEFEKKCQNYFAAFRECLYGENVNLAEYLERKTTNSKVLRYKWLSQRLEDELEAQNWPPTRS